ncbi:MAG TPA: c-type cytochrome [Rhodoblastus sp.]|nr:c-type cytochrome [Rhodoblastus sp.]
MRASLILASLVFAAASVFVAPACAAPDSVAGRRLAQRCKACHSVGARGASPNPAAPPFRTLSQRYPLENLQESLAEGIVVGHAQGMPRVKMTPRQIEDFLSYLQAIQRK